MMIIQNSNGNDYKVISVKDNFYLLEKLNINNHNKFVVAFNVYPDFKGWQGGSYFDSLDEAEKYFNEKTIKESEEA